LRAAVVLTSRRLNHLWSTEPTDKWERYSAYNKTTAPSNTLGFIPNRDNIGSEISMLEIVWAEFTPGLETGSTDPMVYVPRAVAKSRAAGIDKVIADIQRQFDAWYKAKSR
jgi:putative aldouronate transport system substrate-binding protein